MQRTKEKDNTFSQSRFIIMAMFVIIGSVIVFNLFNREKITDDVLNDGWSVTVNNVQYPDCDLTSFSFPITERGDVITMERILPETNGQQVLEMMAHHSAVAAYYGEKRTPIYEYGMKRYLNNKMVGSGFHWIPLPAAAAGQKIRIVLTVSENHSFSFIDAPKLCDGVQRIRNFLKSNLMTICITIVLLAAGLVGILVSIAFCIFGDHRAVWLLHVAAFALLTGLWMSCNYSIIQLISSNVASNTVLEYISLYIGPIPMLFYFRNLFRTENRVTRGMSILIFLAIAFDTVVFTLHFLGIAHMPYTLIEYHVILASELLYLLYSSIRYFKHQDSQNKVIVIGVALLVSFTFVDSIRFLAEKFFINLGKESVQSLIPVGVLAFVTCLVVSTVYAWRNKGLEMTEKRLLSKLAFEDYLTGLGNRTFMEREMERLDDQKKDHYALISLDLNRLKHVNDTYGHEEGDHYIADFAGCLSEFWKEKNGLIGRVGGDEFVVILENAEKSALEEMTVEFEEYIRKNNLRRKEAGKLEMSVSYGIAYYGDKKCYVSRTLYRLADERMYQMKKKYHMGRTV